MWRFESGRSQWELAGTRFAWGHIACALLASGALAFGAEACTAPRAPDEYRSLDDIIKTRGLGHIALGIYPLASSTGSKTQKYHRYLHINESGCYTLNRRYFRSEPSLSAWINNNGDWGEEESDTGSSFDSTGTFVAVHSTSLLTKPQREVLALFRNENSEKRTTAWSRQRYGAKPQDSADYDFDILPAAAVAKYPDLQDKLEFDKTFPKFLAHVVDKDEPTKVFERNDLWEYLLASRPSRKDLDDWSVPRHSISQRMLAIAFDSRDERGGRTGGTPRIQVHISGPCTYLNIQSPREEFNKKIVFEVAGEGVSCKDP